MRRFDRLLTLALLALAGPAFAEPTDVTVRVISQDAKFIGSSMGGSRVVLRDAASGTLLAEGLTEGGTGDTALVMRSEGRSPLRANESTAAFRATLDIEEPTLVTLEAYGSGDSQDSELKVTQQRWLMPGADVTGGDGWVVEMPGISITTMLDLQPGRLDLVARLTLMCGCPITPGGTWPAEEYEVTASAWQGGVKLVESELEYETVTGGWGGAIDLPGEGPHRIVIFARNTRTGNSGMFDWALGAE